MSKEPTEKSTSAQKQKSNYVTTIRDQEDKAVAVNIFRGTSNDGVTYLYGEYSRSWRSKDGKRQGYSSKLLPRNMEAVARIAEEAKEWMLKNEHAADGIIVANAPTLQQ